MRNIILLIVIAGSAFVLSNSVMDGSLKNEITLGGELKSPSDSLYQWNIGKQAPFKYRVLHKLIVSGTYRLFAGEKDNNDLFFLVYRICAFIFQITAILLFYFWMIAIGMKRFALAGAIIFALLPPFLWAYNVPVHTREDMLGYCLLLVGLYAMNDNKPFLILTATVAGVLCRETLLIIPFVNLFFDNSQKLPIRIGIAVAAFAVFFGIRYGSGVNEYDQLEGLRWNLNNLAQVLGFSYLSFGFLIFPFFAFLFRRSYSAGSIQLISRSAPYVFVLIFMTTFVGGMFNEIRIIYLFAPWMIVIAFSYYVRYEDEILVILKSNKYRIYMFIVFTVTGCVMAYTMINFRRFIRVSQYDIPYNLWLFSGFAQLFLGGISLPVVVMIFRKQPSGNVVGNER